MTTRIWESLVSHPNGLEASCTGFRIARQTSGFGVARHPFLTKPQTNDRLLVIDQSSAKAWSHMKFHLVKNW
jgi:hypothetical protein